MCMATVNVGAVVMDARLDTSLFERGLLALSGLAKAGFADIAADAPDISVAPMIQLPDLKPLQDAFAGSASFADILRMGVDALTKSLFGISGQTKQYTESVIGSDAATLALTEAVHGAVPAFDALNLVQHKAGKDGAAIASALGGHWNVFKDGTIAAAGTAAASAAQTAGAAAAMLNESLIATSAAGLGWQRKYGDATEGANDLLIDNMKMAWTGTIPFWGGVGKTIANTVIGVLNSLNGAVVQGVTGLVNMMGGALSTVGNLFGQNWGWQVPATPPMIPYLAKGGIVSQPTVAMIGEAGREAVLPLDGHTGWMNELAAKINRGRPMQAAPATVNLYVDGRKLAEATLADYQSVATRRGVALYPKG